MALSRSIRLFFWAFSALAWGLSLFLLCEFGQRLVNGIDAARNPYIVGQLPEKVRPDILPAPPDYGTRLFQPEAMSEINRTILENLSHGTRSADMISPGVLAALDVSVGPLEAFTSLEEEDRQAFVATRGHWAVRMSPSAELETVYGTTAEARTVAWLENTAFGKLLRATLGSAHWQAIVEGCAKAQATGDLSEETLYLSILSGETEARCSWFPDPHHDGRTIAYVAVNIALREYELPEDTVWEIPYHHLKKNLRPEANADALETNELGFRDTPIEMPKPPNTFRVLCVGGSTTASGTSLEFSYPNIVEARLKASFPESNIEVINGGVSGATTYNHLLKVPFYQSIDPDLVVLYLGANDFLQETRIHFHSRPWSMLTRQSRFLTQQTPSVCWPTAHELEDWMQNGVIHNIDCLVDAFRAQGVPVAIASFAFPAFEDQTPEVARYYAHNMRMSWHMNQPNYQQYSAAMTQYNQLLRDYCKEETVYYLPVAENLRGGADTFSDICHFYPDSKIDQADTIYLALEPYVEALVNARSAHLQADTNKRGPNPEDPTRAPEN